MTEFNSGECRSGREGEACDLVELYRKVEGILINQSYRMGKSG